jgi:DNA-binding MarR family transcriptional regulator
MFYTDTLLFLPEWIIFVYNLFAMNDAVSINLNELELKILSSCAVKALGVKDLAVLLAIDYSGGDMKRAITRLLQLKLIEFTVPEFRRSYAQRYRITLKGKKYVR